MANLPDMYMNHMDYTPEPHRFMFSAGQVARMRATLADGGAREELGLPQSVLTNCIPSPILIASVTQTCTLGNVLFTVQLPSTYNPTDYSLTYFSGNQFLQPVTPVSVGQYDALTNQITFILDMQATTKVEVKLTYNAIGLPGPLEAKSNIERVVLEQPVPINLLPEIPGNPIINGHFQDVSMAGGTVAGSIYTWSVDFPALVTENVIVPDGKKLIIMDKVLMPAGKRIIVLPGGELEVKAGAILTSCNAMWGGVEVWSATINGIEKRGRLDMIDAIIEHATFGVSSGAPIKGQGGAIITIENTIFRNNTHSIYFGPNYFATTPASGIASNKFVTDDAYRSTIQPAHIFIKRAYGITIQGNTLKDIRTNTPLNEKAQGILSYYSNFECERENSFENLSYAIYAAGGKGADIPLPQNTAEDVWINNNEVLDCNRGIYATGFATPTTPAAPLGLRIVNNKITGCVDYSVYIDVCMHFVVENNFIVNTPLGVLVRECGGEENIVYRNNFSKPLSGTYVTHCVVAWGVNRNINVVTPTNSGTKGLQIKCNQMNGEVSHIWVNGLDNAGVSIPNAGVRYLQGDIQGGPNPNPPTTLPAGNTFVDLLAPITNSEIVNSSDFDIKYLYHVTAHDRVEPIIGINQLNVTKTDQPVNFVAASCPDKYPIPLTTTPPTPAPDMTALWQQRIAAQTQAHILTQTLAGLKDGGSTPLIKNEIAFTQFVNAYQLYSSLLAKSPYLSEEALADLAAKEDFPKPLLRDIMVANKHAGKNTDVMETLKNRTDELPEYMLTQIKAAAESGMSGKEIIENNIGAQNEVYQNAVAQQIAILNVNHTASLNDYEAVLGSTESLAHRAELVAAYLRMSDSTATADAIQNFQNNTLCEPSEIADYTALYSTLLSIKVRKGCIDSLSTDELATLTTLANNNTNNNLAQTRARIILETAADNRTYIEPLPVWTNLPPSAARKAKKETTVKVTPLVNVIPNPAHDYVTFEFPTPIECGKIMVFDAVGKQMATEQITATTYSKTFTTQNWANGAYTYRIIADNGILYDGKIIVLK